MEMGLEPVTARPRAMVLVVEDEPLLAMSLVDFIEAAGCEALEVRSAAAAIAILERRHDIRVVLTDLDVRGSVLGMKLAAQIRDRWPPIELILTSSAPHPPRVEDLPVRGVYLGKPFEGAKMIAAIRAFTAYPSAA